MTMGSLYIDEILFPITALHFDDGALIVTAHHPGPVPAVNTDHYELYDRSGSRVYTSPHRIQWSRTPFDMVFKLRLEITSATPSSPPVVLA